MKLEERMDRADLHTLGTFEPDEMLEDLDQIVAAPKVTLRDLYLSADTWLAMTTGEYIGQEAFMLGKVTVESDATAGLRFDELFAPPRP